MCIRDSNSRGHIGTELNNKAETVLQVTKDPTDPDRSIVSPAFIRSKPFENFAFRITDEPDPVSYTHLSLRRAGYQIYVGTNKEAEVDFVAIKGLSLIHI